MTSSHPAIAFSIEFDYRFANGFFDDPVRRKALEDAAAVLENIIVDDFPAVPAGTVINVRNPETGKINRVKLKRDIDDLRIFVFAYKMPVKRKAAAGPLGRRMSGDQYSRRYHGKVFQPWIARISFNTNGRRPWFFDPTPKTSTDIPSQTHYDFFGTAVHELMHALGLQSRVPAFKGWVKNDHFHGPKAKAKNDGKPIPLKKGSSHIRRGFAKGLPRPNIDNFAMHSGKYFQGLRHMPAALELAMLSDIGYTLRSLRDLRLADQSVPADPRRASVAKQCRVTPMGSPTPVGLWSFDRPANWGAALKGRPYHYMPSLKGARMAQIDGGARIPAGGYLMIDHGLVPERGRRRVNRYTVLMEVKLPLAGRPYALMNTDRKNKNRADAWIDAQGRFDGLGSFGRPLQVGRWHQIALSVDTVANRRHYYLNGKLALAAKAGSPDGRYALRPVFLLFADSMGLDSAVDVRRVAVFDAALSGPEIEALTRVGTRSGTRSDWACPEAKDG